MVLLYKCYLLAINSAVILDYGTPVKFRNVKPHKYLKVSDWRGKKLFLTCFLNILLFNLQQIWNILLFLHCLTNGKTILVEQLLQVFYLELQQADKIVGFQKK